MILELCKKQTISSWIWTCATVSTFDDNKNYIMSHQVKLDHKAVETAIDNMKAKYESEVQ